MPRLPVFGIVPASRVGRRLLLASNVLIENRQFLASSFKSRRNAPTSDCWDPETTLTRGAPHVGAAPCFVSLGRGLAVPRSGHGLGVRAFFTAIPGAVAMMDDTNARSADETGNFESNEVSSCGPLVGPKCAVAPGLSILLANGNGLLSEMLASHLDRESDFRVVAQCLTGGAAVEAARRWRPSVALVAAAMPDLQGSAVTRAIRNASPRTFVLALASDEACGNVAAMLREGACGFLPVSCTPSEVIKALKVTALTNGAIRISADYAPHAPPPLPDEPTLARISGGQRAVLTLMARKLSRKEIAENLNISVLTVNSQCRRIMDKLGLCGKEELMRFARAVDR